MDRRLHTTFAERGKEGRGENRERGLIRIFSILSRRLRPANRSLIYEWDIPEVVNGADWPSLVPLWCPDGPIVPLVSPLSFRFVSFSLFYIFFSLVFAWLLISIPRYFFFLPRLLPFLSLDPCCLCSTLAKFTSRQLFSDDCCEQIERFVVSVVSSSWLNILLIIVNSWKINILYKCQV